MKPLYPISSRKFRYTPSYSTSVADTIKRARRRQDRAWNQAHAEYAEREAGNVRQIKRAKS